jgi:hypothetical protein
MLIFPVYFLKSFAYGGIAVKGLAPVRLTPCLR